MSDNNLEKKFRSLIDVSRPEYENEEINLINIYEQTKDNYDFACITNLMYPDNSVSYYETFLSIQQGVTISRKIYPKKTNTEHEALLYFNKIKKIIDENNSREIMDFIQNNIDLPS